LSPSPRADCEDTASKNTKVTRDEKVSSRLTKNETDDPAIYAIGDVAGGVMLAHKASREASRGGGSYHGGNQHLHGRVIPAVIFTDPEVGLVRLTEVEPNKKASMSQWQFPWAASWPRVDF